MVKMVWCGRVEYDEAADRVNRRWVGTLSVQEVSPSYVINNSMVGIIVLPFGDFTFALLGTTLFYDPQSSLTWHRF